MLDLANSPEMFLTGGGPHRWQGDKVRLNLDNGHNYFFRVPEEFKNGTVLASEMKIFGAYKYT